MNRLGNDKCLAGNIYQFTNLYRLNILIILTTPMQRYMVVQKCITFKKNKTDLPNQGNYAVISKIMKALHAIYCRPLRRSPYFEAFKGQENLTPAYDDIVILQELVKELEEARALIQNPSATAESVKVQMLCLVVI
jgi:hypothetical protein